jgi:hypothetical protein
MSAFRVEMLLQQKMPELILSKVFYFIYKRDLKKIYNFYELKFI